MRDTSLLAYKDLQASGDLAKQELKVFKCIKDHEPGGITDKELSILTGININAVTGRRNGLVKKGLVMAGPKRACRVTGKTVYTWHIGGIKQNEL